MAARGQMGGHSVTYRRGAWRYDDDSTPASDTARPCNHCGKPPGLVAVVKPAWTSCTGKERLAAVPVDACLVDLVRRLNAGAEKPVTAGSCCGHGRAPGSIRLADGRDLIIPMEFTEPIREPWWRRMLRRWRWRRAMRS